MVTPQSGRGRAAKEEEDEDDDDDEDTPLAAGDFRCSTVVSEGLPKGPGIPTEVHMHCLPADPDSRSLYIVMPC